MTLQDQLRSAARECFPVQAVMARELGVSDALVSRWLNRQCGLSAEKLDRLGDALAVTVQTGSVRK